MMPQPMGAFHFIADRGDARLRLDQAIVRRGREVAGLSRNRAQVWIEAGAVRVDGREVRRPASRIPEGSAVDVDLPEGAGVRAAPLPEAGPLEILYEDAALIALNKPAGLVVHPSYRNTTGTLLNALLGRLPHGSRPGIVTRLDKDTSGLVLVALTPGIHAAVQRAATAGLVKKEYLAVVRGVPSPRLGTIRLALGRDPGDRRRVIATLTGQTSETRYEVIDQEASRTWPTMSVVRCELVTGRTHQIRVHLAASGWPILGDRVYGGAHETIGRQALHAWRIRLPHPTTGEPITIVAPLPADMTTAFPTLASGW